MGKGFDDDDIWAVISAICLVNNLSVVAVSIHAPKL